jgi:predicted Fe-Mo cluster-binding NifX family protein
LKVAVATDDGKTVSQHFGMARFYLIYDVVGGQVKGKETRPKANHGPGGMEHSHGSEASLHNDMLANVKDCEAVVAGGMGSPMYSHIRNAGIKPVLTEVTDADEAVKAYAGGNLANHEELLHFH